VITIVKLFTTKHHYSILIETNVQGIYNFILSTIAQEIFDAADPSFATTLFDPPTFASDVE